MRAQDSIRDFLIGDVKRFVTRARGISGVRRISLIGSLTTPKENPKDADLLVSVDDQTDLAPLAAASRHLKGIAQSRNHDVLKLDAHVLLSPPLDLWPEIVVRAPVPQDTQQLAQAISESTALAGPTARMT
jgi:hypothetical protein